MASADVARETLAPRRAPRRSEPTMVHVRTDLVPQFECFEIGSRRRRPVRRRFAEENARHAGGTSANLGFSRGEWRAEAGGRAHGFRVRRFFHVSATRTANPSGAFGFVKRRDELWKRSVFKLPVRCRKRLNDRPAMSVKRRRSAFGNWTLRFLAPGTPPRRDALESPDASASCPNAAPPRPSERPIPPERPAS